MEELKGQKHIAQGSALGFVVSDKFALLREWAKALILHAILLVLLPFQGEWNSLK